MGMFKNLMDKIFHADAIAMAPDAMKPGQAAQRPGVPMAQAMPGAPKMAASPAPAATAAAVMEQVDVMAMLDNLAAKNPEKLDWRHSIVDLMKLVGMDSSFASRKELAADLKYMGDMGDSAAMNIWLHKRMMKELADHGGKLPPELMPH